jgi:hypothetical protein
MQREWEREIEDVLNRQTVEIFEFKNSETVFSHRRSIDDKAIRMDCSHGVQATINLLVIQ